MFQSTVLNYPILSLLLILQFLYLFVLLQYSFLCPLVPVGVLGFQ